MRVPKKIPLHIATIVNNFCRYEAMCMMSPKISDAIARHHRAAKKCYDEVFKPWYTELTTEHQIEVDAEFKVCRICIGL
jgi:hypothetical protein